jgi:transposase
MGNYYMGLDVSKGYSDIIIIDSEKKVVEESFQMDDTAVGHAKLGKLLKKFFLENPESKLYSAVESTGGYENNWYNLLSKMQGEMEVYVARNPLGVSHHVKAKMDRIITDKSSARNIAEYQINHKEKIEYSKKEYYPSLRKQWKFVRMLRKQKTQMLNQLQSVLYISNPEVLSYCRHGIPEWLLSILKKYPTAEKLSKARQSGLTKTPYVSAEKAEKLINRAKGSVASATDEMTANLVTRIIEQTQSQETLSNLQMSYIEKKCELPEEIEILTSFKGIGLYSAVGLLIEIGTIDRFESSKKLASFFGIHPVYKESGDGKRGMHMSKQGRREPRAILYMVARSAIVSNPQIREIYKSHRQKGMSGNAAIGVCMHKILRIIFGMLKNREMYNPEKEKAYKEKTITKNKPAAASKLRRYQEIDESAPISGRQNKKRKEQEKSQNENISLKAGSVPCS